MRFSQRHGLTPGLKAIQNDSIDIDLRNRIWNLIHVTLFDKYDPGYRMSGYVVGSNKHDVLKVIWSKFLKEPTDTIPSYYSDARLLIREMYFEWPWHKVFDFVEFLINDAESFLNFRDMGTALNYILEEESSGFRIVGNLVVPIVAPEEIEAVEDAIAAGESFPGVGKHISEATRKLSDREAPDYRNSIKESISAVESACMTLTGDPKATLGTALAVIERESNIHRALKAGMSSIYGYTSDEQGIRHAMIEDSTVTFADAKFMLVACSGFIKYLICKLAESSIDIPDGGDSTTE